MSIDNMIVTYQELDEQIQQGNTLSIEDSKLWSECYHSLRELGIYI